MVILTAYMALILTANSTAILMTILTVIKTVITTVITTVIMTVIMMMILTVIKQASECQNNYCKFRYNNTTVSLQSEYPHCRLYTATFRGRVARVVFVTLRNMSRSRKAYRGVC